MRIRVPATSANLGPGFDCIGIAWECWNEIDFAPAETLSVSGCPAEYRNEENLAWQGAKAAFRLAGRAEQPLRIDFGKTEIPVCRGLGSSAALLAAGAMAADALFSMGLDREGVLNAAASVEGHPDNVAPAVFGGLVASAMEGERAVQVSFPVSERLHFTVLIPDYELPTAEARSVLPASVLRSDAIFNVSRTVLLIRALGDGNGPLLRMAMHDRLHQPYRWSLITGSEQARAAAEDCGAVSVCISGAGSAILCVAEDEDFTRRIAAAIADVLPGWQAKALPIDRQGVQILTNA